MLTSGKLLNLTLALALLGCPAAARAQGGPVAGAAIGAASVDSQTTTVFSGHVGYRFNRALGLGVELTYIPHLEPGAFDGATILRNFVAGTDDAHGHLATFTTNVRVEMPTGSTRVLPYALGGGGIASITDASRVMYYYPFAAASGLAPDSLVVSPILPGPQVILSTSVAMVLTIGGGASVLVTDHVAIDADLRALTFLGEAGRTMARFGVGVSYRF